MQVPVAYFRMAVPGILRTVETSTELAAIAPNNKVVVKPDHIGGQLLF